MEVWVAPLVVMAGMVGVVARPAAMVETAEMVDTVAQTAMAETADGEATRLETGSGGLVVTAGMETALAMADVVVTVEPGLEAGREEMGEPVGTQTAPATGVTEAMVETAEDQAATEEEEATRMAVRAGTAGTAETGAPMVEAAAEVAEVATARRMATLGSTVRPLHSVIALSRSARTENRGGSRTAVTRHVLCGSRSCAVARGVLDRPAQGRNRMAGSP
jgi:hypothetical protein